MATEVTRERLNFSMSRKVKWRTIAKKIDRFGREYITWLDRNNLEPTGLIERHFTAPVDIPDKYLRFPEAKGWRVDLLLEDYARYLKTALQEWEFRYQDIRGKLQKDEPEEKALKIVGPKPQDWRLIVLLSRGDKWCVGSQAERTPAVVEILGPAPTEAQLRAERLKGPSDLRLDPKLEALIGAGAMRSAFPDELMEEGDYDDAAAFHQAARPVRQSDLDPDGAIARQLKMDRALGIHAGDPGLEEEGSAIGGLADRRAVNRDDEVEEELIGDVDIDEEAIAASAGHTDFEPTWADVEENADPDALGGKKVDPRKNRTRPTKE